MIYINPYTFAGLDAVTVAWLAQLTTSFGSNPSAAFITALDTMVRGMRTDGDLTKLDRLWVFAQEVQDYSRVSIVNPSATQITEVNTPGWTANQGYTGNGTNEYLNSNYNLSSSSSNYTQNSASFGVYSRSNTATATTELGCFNGGVPTYNGVSCKFSDNSCYGSVNNSTSADLTKTSITRGDGLICAIRTASNASTLYQNGAELSGVTNKTTVSAALLNLNLLIAANNNNGTPINFSTKQLAMAFIGSGTISQANFYSRFQTFATTRGFNV